MKDEELKEKDGELTELKELRRKMDVEIAQLRAAKESAEREAAKEAERAEKAGARAEKAEARAEKADARADELMSRVGPDIEVSHCYGVEG